MNKNVKEVIDILRRDVPTPWIYPEFNNHINCIRWGDSLPNLICPLGLHPLAIDETPVFESNFKEFIFSSEQIDDFVAW